jgi:ATP-dependent HslUV protease subunit HslV
VLEAAAWLPRPAGPGNRGSGAAPGAIEPATQKRHVSAVMSHPPSPTVHGTTVLSVRRNGKVVVAADGQVTFGQTVLKPNAKKVRRLGGGSVIAGFAGATADAFALFERLEGKLEKHPGQLTRACVELAKDWRTDRYLRRLEAMMAVADKEVSLVLTGTGDVLDPVDQLIGIGSGGPFALAAARALMAETQLDAEAIARRSLKIAADICIYTNDQITLETL